MAEPNVADPPLFLLIIAFFVLFASIISWRVILKRWAHKQRLIPIGVRRRVPWRGTDVLLVILTYVFAMSLSVQLISFFLDLPDQNAQLIAPQATDVSHPVIRILRTGMSDGQGWILGFAVLSVVLVAPIFEEFFFRVVLQGWLESANARYRSAMRPFGFFPIMITSLFFALLHFRTDEPDPGFAHWVVLLTSNVLVSAFVMLGSIAYLKAVRGATAADLGWRKETLGTDIKLGLCSACAILAPLYGIQFVFLTLLPETIAADPFAILCLSIVLGFLYLRTHRVVPGIVLHMCLNGLSLLMALLAFG